MTLIDRIKNGWTTLKFIRVGLGGLILYSSIDEGQVPGIFLGAFFLVFALLTDGVCCAGNACYTAPPATKTKSIENIEYEELGAE
ncbi:MAG: hypothetical protein HZA79_07485 [Sphingobacteriales bacterium]|nr:hypothetical protein [Sphingobacteriales bacterium]